MERWLPVVGFEGAYEVSDLGRVRSLDRTVTQRTRSGKLAPFRLKGKLLRPGAMSSGHLTVSIGKGNSRCVHALVLEAFDGPAPVGFEARHRNGVESDNRYENLVWSTRGDNTRDKKWHKGCAQYKLSPIEILNIKSLLAAKRHTQRHIASLFDVSESTVSLIKKGRIHTDVRLGN